MAGEVVVACHFYFMNIDILNKHQLNRLHSSVKKAHFAYHASIMEEGAHKFYSDSKFSQCQWCGRSRYNVRYDNKQPQCNNRPETPFPDLDTIQSTIKKEEQSMFDLLDKANRDLPSKVDNPKDLSGKEIGVFQHTHGYTPDIVQGVLNFTMSKQQKIEYNKEINRHKQASK